MADSIDKIVQEIADDLFPAFEAAEAQSAAVLQFLKDRGIATDEELSPYLDQAGNASSVRWRAVRVRLEHLVSSAVKISQDSADAKQKQAAAPPKAEKPPQDGGEKLETNEPQAKEGSAAKTQAGNSERQPAAEVEAAKNSEAVQSDGAGSENPRPVANEDRPTEAGPARKDAA